MLEITRNGNRATATLYGKTTAVFTGRPTDKEISQSMYSLHAQKLEREADQLIREAYHKLRAAAHVNRHYVQPEAGDRIEYKLRAGLAHLARK